jgi:hypothetical protein
LLAAAFPAASLFVAATVFPVDSRMTAFFAAPFLTATFFDAAFFATTFFEAAFFAAPFLATVFLVAGVRADVFGKADFPAPGLPPVVFFTARFPARLPAAAPRSADTPPARARTAAFPEVPLPFAAFRAIADRSCQVNANARRRGVQSQDSAPPV